MPCCVPGCTNQHQTWTTKLPFDKELLRRWKIAIEIGIGRCVRTEEVKGGSPICNAHFALPKSPDGFSGDEYREPSLFARENVLIEVASCQLCLRFDTTERMFNRDGTLGGNRTFQSALHIFFSPHLIERQIGGKGLFCESCAVRIDITYTFWQEMNIGIRLFSRLLEKMDSEKMVWTSDAVQQDALKDTQDDHSLDGSDLVELIEVLDDFTEETPLVAETAAVQSPPESPVAIKMETQSPPMSPQTQETPPLFSSEKPNELFEDIIVKEESQLAEPVPIQTENVSKEGQTSESNKGELSLERSSYKPETDLPGADRMEVSNSRKFPAKHRNVNAFKCYICNSVLKSRPALIEHLTFGHVGRDLYKCKKCLMDFMTITTYNNHLATHYAGKMFRCGLCPSAFEKLVDKMNHEVTDHGMPRQFKHTCVCGIPFNSEKSLAKHQLEKHPTAVHKRCDKCGKTFPTAISFKLHMRWHRQQNNRCSLCNAEFSRKRQLMEHVDVAHKDGKPHATRSISNGRIVTTCSECHEKFNESHQTVGHFKEKHPGIDFKYYPCAVCTEVFFTQKGWFYHERLSHTESRVTCKVCSERFETSEELRQHKKTHDEQYHACPGCFKKFSISGALGRHKRHCIGVGMLSID